MNVKQKLFYFATGFVLAFIAVAFIWGSSNIDLVKRLADYEEQVEALGRTNRDLNRINTNLVTELQIADERARSLTYELDQSKERLERIIEGSRDFESSIERIRDQAELVRQSSREIGEIIQRIGGATRD